MRWFFCALMLATVSCGNELEDEGGTDQATVVGRIQGTEFAVPSAAASVWLMSDGIGALRLSERTAGCGAPDGWSVLVQVNTSAANEYPIGLGSTSREGEGFLVEYRRDDGSVDMPSEVEGALIITYEDDRSVAGSLVLETDGDDELAAVFEAPRCEATALVSP